MSEVSSIQSRGFSDTFQTGLAAAVYFRLTNGNFITVSYLCKNQSRCHLDNRFILISSDEGSEIRLSGCPMMKCPGDRTDRSSGSSESGHKGLELSTASICVRRVINSSYVEVEFPRTLRKLYLTDFTSASHFPPNCGAAGELKMNLVSSLASS